MSFFKWSDKYSVSVLEMDEQHKKLLNILNEHFEAMSQNKGNDVLVKIFDELLNYTKIHFSAEEKYMQKYDFPGYEAQKKEHEYFINKVKSFQEDLASEKLALPINVSVFLKEWLLKHISVEDKKYGSFFNKHGLH